MNQPLPLPVLAAGLMLAALAAFSTGCSTAPTYDTPASASTIESRFLTTIEDVDRTRWHHHRSSNIYGYGNLPLEVYIGQSLDDPERVWLRLRIRWEGIRWMFLDGVTVTTDGARHNLNNLRFKRDIPSQTSSRVVESVDVPVGSKQSEIIQAIIDSDVAFQDVLTAHDMLLQGETP